MTNVACIYMGHARTPGACEIYRGNMPLHYLGKQKGWNTGWMYWDDVRAQGATGAINLVAQTDIFVFPRMYAPDDAFLKGIKDFFEIIHSFGKRIVYEVDDDYSNEFRHVVDGDAIGVASLCDAITVTTPYLGERMKKLTGKPYHVLPNMLDPVLWRTSTPPQRLRKDEIIISLTGSPTHVDDWRVLERVLPRIMGKYPQVRLVIGGFHPPYLLNLPNTTYLEPLPYEMYSQVIRGSDIILCPVNDDPFNIGKSPIKAIEGQGASRTFRDGSKMGAAVIASNNPIYKIAIQSGKNGLLVDHNPDSWYNAIEHLVQNPLERLKLQKKAHQFAWGVYDISKGAKRWAKAYETILSEPLPSLVR